MKKKVLSLALVVMSCVSFSAFAQNDANVKNDVKCEKNEECCRKPQFKCAFNPFEGLNLTDEQKTQLQNLREKRKAEFAEQKNAKRAEKQRNDSIKFADRKNFKKNYLNDIKSILTPEQYVTFLENSFMDQGNKAPRPDKMRKQGKNPHKSGMAGKHGKEFRNMHPRSDK